MGGFHPPSRQAAPSILTGGMPCSTPAKEMSAVTGVISAAAEIPVILKIVM